MDIVKTVEDTLTSLRNHIAKLEEKANDNLPPNMKVETIPTWNSPHMDYIFKVKYDSYYKTDHLANTEEQINKCLEKHEKTVIEYIEKINLMHANNGAALENNKKLKEKLSFMMSAAGIPAGYTTYEYPTTRSKTKKSIGHTAGYIGDLQRNISSTDSYDFHKSAAEKSLVAAREESVKRIAKIKEIKRQEVKEKAKVDAEKVIVHLRVKYETRYDADASEILDAILEKNKYLHLGHYLEANRIDWNDGPSYAERGLNGFTIETKEDEKMYDTIHGLIEDWGGDGRVFSNWEFGYGFMFSKVSESDPALYKDYELIKEKINALS